MDITFLIKLRDAATMIADACNDELEKTNPTKTQHPSNIEYEKIPWITAKNQKGEQYERYPAYQQQADKTNQNYMALLQKIKQEKYHKHGGLNYWIFKDETTIGRKPKQ